MALAATQMAFEDASFDPAEFDEWSTSAITASSSGGNEFGQKEIQSLWGRGPKFVGAYQSIAWFYAATTGQISIRHGLKGPCGVVIAEGAGGLEALQHSRRTIRRGVDTVVSGGCEAPIGPYALTCQVRQRLSEPGPPARGRLPPVRQARQRLRPRRGRRDHLVESMSRAEQREAPNVYAEIAGYGATNDAHHWGGRRPDGKPARPGRSPSRSRTPGRRPEEVDAVFADAFGVPEFDTIEVEAIKQALGRARARCR